MHTRSSRRLTHTHTHTEQQALLLKYSSGNKRQIFQHFQFQRNANRRTACVAYRQNVSCRYWLLPVKRIHIACETWKPAGRCRSFGPTFNLSLQPTSPGNLRDQRLQTTYDCFKIQPTLNITSVDYIMHVLRRQKLPVRLTSELRKN